MPRSRALRFTEEQFAAHQSRPVSMHQGQIVVPERDILAALLELLKHHPKVAWAMRSNTGCGFLLRRATFDRLVSEGHLDRGEARFMQFGVKGAADITSMLRGGRRLEVEAKTIIGTLTDDQRAFGEAVNGGGGLYLVARSVDDVMRGLVGA